MSKLKILNTQELELLKEFVSEKVAEKKTTDEQKNIGSQVIEKIDKELDERKNTEESK